MGINTSDNVVDLDATIDSANRDQEPPYVAALNRIASNFEQDGSTAPTLIGDAVGFSAKSLVELLLGTDSEYSDVASGMSATSEGDFFYIDNGTVSVNGLTHYDIYINDGVTGGLVQSNNTRMGHFDRIENSLNIMKAYADDNGLDIQTDLLFSFIQGQSDSGDYVSNTGYTRAYADVLSELIERLNNTADNILGQDVNIIAVIGQQAGDYVSQSQLEYVASSSNSYLGALEGSYQREHPEAIDYQTGNIILDNGSPSTDVTHLNPIGYNLLGQDTGQIMYEILTGQRQEDEFISINDIAKLI